MKILLVEDDFIVRKGIILSLDWEKEGMEICGEAANGEQGIKMAEKYNPDIIITDIRMPIMDGLEFSRKIKQLDPEMEIIILSGYDDFEYARQAIGIGVYEYLLKPIDADELLKSVCRLRDDLQAKEKIKKIQDDRDKILKENALDIHDHLLNKIILPSFLEYESKIMSDLHILGIELPGPKYRVLLAAVDDFFLLTQKQDEDEKNRILGQIRNMICAAFSQGNRAECFTKQNCQFVIIMNYQSVSKLYIEDCCLKLRKKILEEIGFMTTISCGNEKGTLKELYLSYQEAVSALRCHTCQTGQGVLYFEEKMLKKEEVFLETKDKENILIEALLKYDIKGMKTCLDVVFQKALQDRENYEKVKSACIRLGVIIISNLEEMTGSLEDNVDSPIEIMWKIQQYNTIEGLQHCMDKLLIDVAAVLESAEKEKYSTIIGCAIQYIEKNYQQKISVKSMAEELYITPNYFSRIFKSQMGTNFIDYLNEYRIKKAKKYLTDLKLKVYEVAELSGYQNYKYFNKVFKKLTGCSPKEYRNMIEGKQGNI